MRVEAPAGDPFLPVRGFPYPSRRFQALQKRWVPDPGAHRRARLPERKLLFARSLSLRQLARFNPRGGADARGVDRQLGRDEAAPAAL